MNEYYILSIEGGASEPSKCRLSRWMKTKFTNDCAVIDLLPPIDGGRYGLLHEVAQVIITPRYPQATLNKLPVIVDVLYPKDNVFPKENFIAPETQISHIDNAILCEDQGQMNRWIEGKLEL